MGRSDQASLQIALGTIARAKYARLLSADDRLRIARLDSAPQLLDLLEKTPGWGDSVRGLPPDCPDRRFAAALDGSLYAECEDMYHFAEETAREYLRYIALRVKIYAILSALRRLIWPEPPEEHSPLPAVISRIQEYDLEPYYSVTSYPQLLELTSKGVFGDTLSRLPTDPVTGLPHMAEASDMLESRYFQVLQEFLSSSRAGPERKALISSAAFRADLLQISYLLRLRRFKTPPDRADDYMPPLTGGIDEEDVRAVLNAADDAEAQRIILHTQAGRRISWPEQVEPDRFIREAESRYYRHVIHNGSGLAVANAYLVLKESEGNMLKRVYVALQYGVDHEKYM